MVRCPRPLVNYTLDTRSSLATCIASIATPPADTRRVPTTRLRRFLETGSTDADDSRRVCACTFYLVFKEPEFLPAPPANSSVVGRTLQSYVNPFALSTPPVFAPSSWVPAAFWRRVTVPGVPRAEATVGVASFEGVTAAFATGKVTLGINQYTRRITHCQPRPLSCRQCVPTRVLKKYRRPPPTGQARPF